METTSKPYHINLANYFASKSLYLDEPTQKKPNTRKLVEQPWQQTKGELWAEVTKTLSNLLFIEAKVRGGLVPQLQKDYEFVIDSLPETTEMREKEQLHKLMLKKYIKDLIIYSSNWNEYNNLRFRLKNSLLDDITFKMKLLELKEPENILPNIEINELSTKNECKLEIESRRSNDRLEKLSEFLRFLKISSHIFMRPGEIPKGAIIQHAWNFKDSGLIADEAKICINADILIKYLLCTINYNNCFDSHNALIRTLEKHTGGVESVCISPDGKHIVSGSQDCTIRVWNIENGRCICVLKGDIGVVKSIAMSLDNKIIVSGSSFSVRVWNIESGENIKTLDGHTAEINSVCLTPDNRLAVSGSLDGSIRIWDIKSEENIKTYLGHTSSVNCVKITPNGRTIISCSSDKTIRIWNIEVEENVKILNGHTARVVNISISLDNKLIVSCSEDDTIRVWDIKTGKNIKTIECPKVLNRVWSMLTQFENLVYSKSKANCVCFSPDSKFAITGNSDNTVRVWDLRNEENIQTLEGHLSPINSVCISIDGRRIVSGSGNSWMPMGRSDNTIKVWNFEPNRDIEKRNNPKSVVNCVCVTYDRKWAVSGNMDKTLRVWDIETGENLKIIEGHKDRVNSVCLMLGGRRLVSGSSDMTLKVWDIQTGENLKTLEGHKDAVLCACITPDSKLIISGSIDQTICIWDFETGKCFKILKGHTSSINCICLSPDGRMLISGSGDILSGSANIFMSAKATNSDNTIRIWDVETGENLSTLTGHTSLIKSVCVTPDNKFIVSGSADGTVRVWDIKSKNNILILSGHINHVSSVIVTPDGKEIISGSCGPGSFHTVRVWDIETGENISTFHSKSDVYAISRISMDRLFIVGTGEGITCIRMINFSRDMALTPQRLWHFGNNGLSGKWSDNITAFCEYCGSYFKLPRMILNNIKYFNKNNFLTSGNEPCYQSMKENLDESDYISVCPKCNNKLKFNPFMVHDPEEAERNRIVLENQRYSKVLETAENAFNESDWDNAFNLFLSLIQAERFDINYLRFKMALCRINSLDVYKPEIIANIEVLKRLLSESGESEKVQRINDNLIDRIEAIKKAKKTWWKIF